MRPIHGLFALNLLVWGYNWIPLHILLGTVGPATLSALRVAGGSLALFAVLAVGRKPLRRPVSHAFIAVGLLQVSGMVGMSTLALLFGDVSRTAILLFTMPFWTTLLSRLFLRQRVGLRRWVALAIALSGIAFVALHSSDPRSLAGAAFAIVGAIFWAAGSVVTKRFPDDGDLTCSVAWQQLVGAVPLIIIALALREPLPAPTTTVVIWLPFAAFIGSGLGWLLWASVLKRLSAPNVALGSLAIPVIAAVAAFLQLGERPDPVTLAGLLTVLVAIAIATVPLEARAYQTR